LSSYIDALELMGIALGALLVVSICFVGLSFGLQWLARPRKKEKENLAAEPEVPIAPVETPSTTHKAPSKEAPLVTKPIQSSLASEGVIISLMPGIVVAVKVRIGDLVKVGDILLTIEAMKIQNEITSHTEGRIREIFVEEGAYVKKREALVAIA
jgi:biotin carboxyl carrier protein